MRGAVVSWSVLVMFGCSDPEKPTEDISVDAAKGKVDAFSPRACTTSDGTVHVAWFDNRDGENAIQYNRSGDGGVAWMPSPITLNTGKAAATNPAIACDDDFIYVVWEDVRDSEYGYPNIYANSSEDGGRHWAEEDTMLDADPEGDHISLSPQVVADGDNAYVVWADGVNGAYDIFVQSTTNAGQSWRDTPVRVDTNAEGAAYSANPRIATDGEGNVVVVWEDRRDGGSDIYANFSEDKAKTFSDDDIRLDGGDDKGSTDSFLPQVAMNEDGVYAAWHDNRYGDNQAILLNGSTSHGTEWWDDAQRVETDALDIADSQSPRVAVGGGRVHVVWQDNRAGGYDIFHRSKETGDKDWDLEADDGETEETRLESDWPGEAQSYEPVLDVAGSSVIVAWRDFRNDSGDSTNDLYYNYSNDAGETWQGDDFRINSNAPGSTYVTDAYIRRVDATFTAVWADGRTGYSRVYSASRAMGEESNYIEPEE